jgi:hypothetical protein
MKEETLFEVKRISVPARLQEMTKMRITTRGIWFASDLLPINRILDIYIQEQNESEICRKTIIQAFEENGEPFSYSLDEREFPSLAANMTKAINNGYADIIAKKGYSDSEKWIVASCADLATAAGRNPFILAGAYKRPEYTTFERKVLHSAWGLDGTPSLLRLLSKHLSGNTLNKLKRLNRSPSSSPRLRSVAKKMSGKEELCIWAHELERVISMAGFGYICDWLTLEESYSWSIVAGRRLQALFNSWDEFMEHFLLGLCFFLESEDHYVLHMRIDAWRRRKEYLSDPWRIPWDTPLVRTWKSKADPVNLQGSKLPDGFIYLPELRESDFSGISDRFQQPLEELSSFIEEGSRSVEEVEAVLHCALHKAIKLKERLAKKDPKLAEIAARSFDSTAKRILDQFNAPLSVEAARGSHK